MNWEIPQLLQIAGAAIVALLCVLYKYHEDRLKTLEITRQNKSDADQQRAELRGELQSFRNDVSKRFETMSEDTAAKRLEAHHELQNFKTDISSKVEVMRVEINTKMDKLFDHIASLSKPARKR